MKFEDLARLSTITSKQAEEILSELRLHCTIYQRKITDNLILVGVQEIEIKYIENQTTGVFNKGLPVYFFVTGEFSKKLLD